jgi:GT2 family glycosyltransferase
MGDRNEQVEAAVRSIHREDSRSSVLVIANGCTLPSGLLEDAEIVSLAENVGVPRGRDFATRHTSADLLVFLDDDAEVVRLDEAVWSAFDDDPRLAVVTMSIVDELGGRSRRHVPRIGRAGADRQGDVATFLGGACIIRKSAYLEVGGYWADLVYGHEELDLAWRLTDAGHRIAYVPSCVVRHPRTEISRHSDGWRLTGRNRVLVARRNLPWPIALLHVVSWLLIGLIRAPNLSCRNSYVSGWLSGWKKQVDRRPVSWRTIARLARLGRPPVI